MIRFQRMGKKKSPAYRLVLSEKARDPQAKSLEILGQYNPVANPKVIELNKERIAYWLGMGAKPSESVHNLFVQEGLMKADRKAKSVKISNKRRDAIAAKQQEAEEKRKADEAAQAEEAAKAEEATEVPAEAPKEEEKKEETPAEEKKEETPAEQSAEEESPSADAQDESAKADSEDEKKKEAPSTDTQDKPLDSAQDKPAA